VSLGGGAQTPKEKGALLLGSSALVGHNAGMPPAYDFKLALTRVIEPTGGPGVELATHCGKVIVEPRSLAFL
jgi:hypothetical protein